MINYHPALELIKGLISRLIAPLSTNPTSLKDTHQKKKKRDDGQTCKQKQWRGAERLRQSLRSAPRHHQYLSVRWGNCCSNLASAPCRAWGPFDSVIPRARLSVCRKLQLDQKRRHLLCRQKRHLGFFFPPLHLLPAPFYKTMLSISTDLFWRWKIHVR